MKKLLTLISIIFFFSCSENLREEITERYDNGNKKLLVKYKGEGSDEVVVERIIYGETGDTVYHYKTLEDYTWKKIREKVTEKYDDGKTKTLVKYHTLDIDGKIEEEIIGSISYNERGDITKFIDEIKKTGYENTYYSTGKLEFYEEKYNGKVEGKWISYYEDGLIFMERNYKDGKQDGKWTKYYEDGQIELEGNYKDGIENGKWTYYYQNGKIKSVGDYDDKEKYGRWYYYDDGGNEKYWEDWSWGELSNSNRNGEVITYYNDDENSNGDEDGDDNDGIPKNQIGDWGEKFVFRYFLENKYSDLTDFEDTELGFTGIDNSKNTIEVKWLNRNKGVGKGYDFVIIENDEEIEYIEVKTTIKSERTFHKITGTQWEFARRLLNEGNGGKYKIYAVKNANSHDAKIKEISNPIKLWKEGNLYAHPIQFRV